MHKFILVLLYAIHLAYASATIALSDSSLIWRGPAETNLVALTFDDGPKPEQAIPVLNLLDKYRVKATFLVVGREAKTYPDLVYRMTQSGHQVENHSYSHPRLDTLSRKEIALELSAANDIIFSITGVRPKFLRPPGGRYNKWVIDITKSLNMSLLMWNVNAGDYVATATQYSPDDGSKISTTHFRSAADITERILLATNGGSIILFHDGGTETLNALPKIIEGLRAKGLEFATVNDVLAAHAPPAKTASR